MRTVLILILVMTIFNLSAFISDLSFEETIYRTETYEAYFHIHNNRLYVDARYSLEEYEINDDGSLELISYYFKDLHDKIAGASIVLGDTLIFIDYYWTDGTLNGSAGGDIVHTIKSIDISVSPMQLINAFEFAYNEYLSAFEANDDYLFLKFTESASNFNSVVLDRRTLEIVTEIETGYYFSVRDNLLFVNIVNWDLQTSYDNIYDISNIHDPQLISVLTYDNTWINGNFITNDKRIFNDNLMFVLHEQYLVNVVDLSDIYNPAIISTIDDFEIQNALFTNLVFWNDYIIITNWHNNMWVYDISDIYNPEFVNYLPVFKPTNSKGTIIVNNDDLYYANGESNMIHYDLNMLPEFYKVGEYGVGGTIHPHFTDFCYPYFIFAAIDRLMYFDVRNDLEVHLLYSNELGYTSITHSDSLIFVNIRTEEGSSLLLYYFDDYGIEFIDTVDPGFTFMSQVYWQDPYLIIRPSNINNYYIYSVQEDYSLSLVHTLPTTTSSFFVQRTQNSYDDYLFIARLLNNYYQVNIYHNEPPFEQYSVFSFQDFPPNTLPILYSYDRFILVRNHQSHVDFNLYSYQFPNIIEDHLHYEMADFGLYRVIPEGIFCSYPFTGVSGFYELTDNDIILRYLYDFPTDAHNIAVVEEEQTIYVAGGSGIFRYSYQPVSVEDIYEPIPQQITLYQNYPNPFNPDTVIEYHIDTPGNVCLEVFNIAGRKVATLEDGYREAGQHLVKWDGKNEKGVRMGSGVYLYRLSFDNRSETRKMILLK